jgi:hypothetical protein
MRAAEFLKTLIDLVDKGELDMGKEQSETDNTGNFIPPLQQEIELMKKTAGVTSEFDQEEQEDSQTLPLLRRL